MAKTIIHQSNDLALVVRNKRKKDGLTQAEAAALCGVGTRFLSDIENGKNSLHFSKVLKVLEGLGLVVEVRERGYQA